MLPFPVMAGDTTARGGANASWRELQLPPRGRTGTARSLGVQHGGTRLGQQCEVALTPFGGHLTRVNFNHGKDKSGVHCKRPDRPGGIVPTVLKDP